jgi:DNA replication initiation complex subunit (GINS family)
MKISELRALLDRISSEDLKEILVEVYRALSEVRMYLGVNRELLSHRGAERFAVPTPGKH